MADPLREAEQRGQNFPGQNEVRYWADEISFALKREEKWRKQARKLLETYEAEDADAVPENSFNILYSNTETLLPALYNALPRPLVRRRFDDSDPMARAVAQVVQRTLSYYLDSASDDHLSFDDGFKLAVFAALVPGRGVLRLRYDVETEEVEPISLDPLEDGEEREENEPEAETPPERVVSEGIYVEEVPYDRMILGYSRKWSTCPWVGFLHKMTRMDLKRNFGAAIAIKVNVQDQKDGLDGENRGKSEEDNVGTAKTVDVWEIWHKARKSVLFVCPSYEDQILKRIEDPLGFAGFFPTPTPLRFVVKANSLRPSPLYNLYRQQARELNRVTQRINKILEHLKVRGFYDSQIREIQDLMAKEDGDLLPAKNIASFNDSQSLEKHIWLMPLEKLIQVLQQLYIQRDQTKQVIYELTGISDILRGASVASETATAQNIKNQWGTLRLRRMQATVQIYVRDCLRMIAELVAKKLSVATLKQITGLPFVDLGQKQQAQEMLAAVGPRMQELQAASQQGTMPPEAVQQLQQQVQQMQQVAGAIAWEEIMQVLQSDLQRSYKIDIETNSTIDIDATEDQKNIADLMQALAQFLSAVGPMVQEGILPLSAVKGMLLVITRRFRFGPEIEDYLMQMAEQMPQRGPDPKQLQSMQEQLQKDGMKLEFDKREFELNKKFALKEIDFEKKIASKELDQQFQVKQAAHDIGVQQDEQNLAIAGAKQMASVDAAKTKATADISATATKAQSAAAPDRQIAQMMGQNTKVMAQVGQAIVQLAQAVQGMAEAAGAERELVVGPNGTKRSRRVKATAQ